MSDFVLDYRRCRYGHPRTPENTTGKGKNAKCRQCTNEGQARRYKGIIYIPFVKSVQHPPVEACEPGTRLLFLGGRNGAGKFAIIDAEDFEKTAAIRWCCNGYGYPVSRRYKLHRLILDAQASQHVDHINGNVLDNRKANLRFVTHQQNMRNLKKQESNKVAYKSVYKGVSKAKNNKWDARICVSNRRIWLGSFNTEIEAAQAYDEASLKYH